MPPLPTTLHCNATTQNDNLTTHKKGIELDIRPVLKLPLYTEGASKSGVGI